MCGPKPYEFTWKTVIRGPKIYGFIGEIEIHGPKPYEFTWKIKIHGHEPYEFIVIIVSHGPKPMNHSWPQNVLKFGPKSRPIKSSIRIRYGCGYGLYGYGYDTDTIRIRLQCSKSLVWFGGGLRAPHPQYCIEPVSVCTTVRSMSTVRNMFTVRSKWPYLALDFSHGWPY